MLTKFDSKSNRVKGLSFHPKRPWILASLHNGVIQLWDYRMGTLLDTFEEHIGPVRGINFHRLQPLFVSGGDDYKIKVWDYKLRRCLFTLQGHLDYIRTVQFHHEYPWIVSASDDQTIRIWNWQSRTLVSVLTGHNHYVMCAQFHPKDDLVVSASLDQTIRVWDTSGLRKKTVRGAPVSDDHGIASRVNSDLFGGNDAMVKYVLEGHDRGANWASFHHTLPLIVSGADDRQVKLWRMNETKAWEVDTMRGHTNNVSCVIFHPRHELVISNSEDRSIRTWDMAKRMGIQTFRREVDRFWILAAHPEQNLLAAGHDSGMLVFKLERERPAYGGVNGSLFYVKDRYLRKCVLGSGVDVPVLALRRTGSTRNYSTQPRTLVINTFNPSEDNILIHSHTEGGQYSLYCLNQGEASPMIGNGLAAVFVARARFATLAKNRELVIRGLDNQIKKRLKAPYSNADFLFPASTSGRLIVRAEDKVALFETQSRRVINEIQGYVIKYVVWSTDGNHVALLGKNAVVIADKDLKLVCSVCETVAVKSGVWDEQGVFVYTTLNHIKYVLPTDSGDSGIVRTLDVPVYATECRGTTLHCLDRDGKTLSIMIDPTEYMFKLALAQKQYAKVMAVIKGSRLCGQAVIAYLQRAGYPEVALHFVEDERTRFSLALECGNLEIAHQAAQAVNKQECWNLLAVEALRQGNHSIVEMAFQQTQDYDRLSFLYLITGNIRKLEMMMKIADVRKDVMSRFHNALYLGNVAERVKVLESAGQIPLAFLLAATNGCDEDATRLKEALESAGLPVPEVPAHPVKFVPPTPIVQEENWPLLTVSRGPFDGPITDAPSAADAEVGAADDADVAAWGGDDLDLGFGGEDEGKAAGAGDADIGGDDIGDAWGDDLDLGLDGITLPSEAAGGGAAGAGGDAGDLIGGDVFVAPSEGTSFSAAWMANSSCAADHVAAGSFETAMQLLNRQIGIVNFAPLKQRFMSVFMGARAALPTLPSLPSLDTPLTRNPTDAAPPGSATLPNVCVSLASLVERLKLVYKSFQGGKFSEASEHLDYLFSVIPLVVVANRSEAGEVKELLGICTEYKTAVHIELTRKACAGSGTVERQLELAAYLTHCNLQPTHLMLTLNLAMSVAFKSKNFINAASFARRLIELGAASGNGTLVAKAKKVLTISESEGRNAHSIEYDERNPFTICCGSLTPIYKGSPIIRSPYCNAGYKPEFKGTLCTIDGMSQVGTETVGLVCTPATSARR